MASLYLTPALPAMTHADIETAHDGAPHDLFLILGLVALWLYAATAMRTLFGQSNGDLLVYTLRNRTARLLAISLARLATRPLGVVLG